ncbi:MAG: hypothetical protein RL458_3497, partial [Pseudomonadota bacterium]
GWSSVTISADGKTIAAAASGGPRGLWVITEGGNRWRMMSDLGIKVDAIDWTAIELDAEGQTLYAAGLNNRLYTLPVTPVNAAPSLLVPDAIGAVAGESTQLVFDRSAVADADSSLVTVTFFPPEGGYLDASLNRDVVVNDLLVTGVAYTADRGGSGFVTGAEGGPTGGLALRSGELALGYPSIDNNGTARQMLSGFFVPDRSGTYQFDLDANDRASLWFETSGSGVTSGGTFKQLVLDTEAGGSSRSEKLSLLAGKRYYFELRHAEQRNITKEGFLGVGTEYDTASYARLGYLLGEDTLVQPLTSDRVIPAGLPDVLTATVSVPTVGVKVTGASNAWPDRSNSPANALAANAVDGQAASAYLNYHTANSGLVFAYPTALAATAIRFTTSNAAAANDPVSFVLYGSNDSADWNSDSWQTVASGNTFGAVTATAPARGASTTVALAGEPVAYRYYKVLFPTVRDAAKATAMQIAEVSLRAGDTALQDMPFGRLSLAPVDAGEGITVDPSSTAARAVLRGSAPALQAYLGSAGNVFYDGNAQSVSIRLTGAQTGRVSIDRTISLPRVSVNSDAESFSITGTADTIADYLSRPGNLTFTATDVFRLELKGEFAAGSTIRIGGIAAADLVYTVVANDLTVKGDGTGGAATAEQAAANIASRVAAQALAAQGLRADVTVDGSTIRFESREGDPAGSLSVRATATGGVAMLTRPAGSLVMRVDDGVNVRQQTITLDVTRPSAINAVFNGTGLEVIDPNGTSMRLSRFALDDIRLGSKADSFTLTRLGAAPMTVVATEGADKTLVNLGNTVSPDGSLRQLTLKDAFDGTRSLLADDMLTLALKPQPAKSNGEGTLVRLGRVQVGLNGAPDVIRMLSGVEDVRWDATLGQLVIQGDIIRLAGFTDAQGNTLPMDLGQTKVRIVAKRLSIESDLIVGALTLDVSERIMVDGQLLRYGGAPIALAATAAASSPALAALPAITAVGGSPITALSPSGSGAAAANDNRADTNFIAPAARPVILSSEAAQQLQQAGGYGTETLTITVTETGAQGGVMRAQPAPGITINGSDTARAISGTWAALRSYLARADGLVYLGNAASLKFTVTSSIAGKAAQTLAVSPAGVQPGFDLGDLNAGLKFTLAQPAAAKALSLTTARTDARSDPASFTVFGSNNDLGWNDTGWTLIAENRPTNLPTTRGATVDATFTNNTAYRYYKVVFNGVRDAAAGRVQIAEARLSVPQPTAASGAASAIDLLSSTRYMSVGDSGNGMKLTLASAAKANELVLTSAADLPGRDPMTVSIYGSNDDLAWASGAWVELARNAASNLLADRGASSAVAFANDTAYRYYKLVFGSSRDAVEGAVQIAEVGLRTVPAAAGKFEFAQVIPADRAPQIVTAQKVDGALDAAALAKMAADNAGQGLQLKPADASASISIGGAGGGSGVSLDPSQVSAIPVLVVGSTGGSNPVALGGAGTALAMTTPLVIQAQGDGGKVRVGGKIKGTKTEVQGSGNTTEFDGTSPGGTELEMTEGLYINDALRIFGDVTLTAGDTARTAVVGAQEYRLELSGNFAVGDLITVRGAAAVDITLTVGANDLTADGAGGGGAASAAQALANIAARLRATSAATLANPASGARATVDGTGAGVRFTGLKAGDEGDFTVTATVIPLSSGGVVSVATPDLTVTGRINGSDRSDDSLTLRALGGDITIQGRIGSGIGSSLEQGDFSFVGGAGYATESGRGSVALAVEGTVATLRLSGDFVAGDQVVVRGVAQANVLYTVTAKDLTANGNGGGGVATAQQAYANIAAKVASLLTERATGNAAGAKLSSASASGSAFVLSLAQAGLEPTASVGRLYSSVPLLGGTGAGATAHIVVTDGVATSVALESLGGGYVAGDVLTVARASLGDTTGSGDGFSLTVNRIIELEALRITEAVDVNFQDRVYVDGNLTIRATGTITFADELVIFGSGKLVIEGATSVIFNRGVRLAGGAGANSSPISITPAANDDVTIVFGASLLAGDSNSFKLSGVQSFSVAKQFDTALNRLVVGDVAISGAAGRTLAMEPALGRSTAALTAQKLTITNAGNIRLDATLGASSLAVTSTSGAITQSAAGSMVVAGAPSFSAGGAIQLAGANRFGGNVTATAGGALTVRDGDAMSGSFTSVGDMRLEAAGNLTLAGSVGGAGSDLTLIALAGGTVTLGSIGSVPGDLTVYASGAITQTGALSVAGETRIEGQQLSFTGTGSTALSQSALPIQISTAEGRWVAVADRTAIAVSGTASALAGATVERVVLAQAGSGSANAVVQAAGDIAVNSAAGRWVAAASRSAVDLSGTASTAAGSTLTLTFTDAAGKTVQRTATVSNGAWTLSGINLFTLADSGPVRLTITGAGATWFEQAAFLNVGTPAPESATDTVFPQITRVDGPAAGVYAAGRTMMFAVRFSETVNVDTAAGSPALELALNTPAGNQTGRAEYMPALSSAATKVFRYTVPVGTTVNAAQPGALVLNSAALSDVAGNRIGALTVRFTDALGASVVRNASVANGSWSLAGVDLSSLTGRGSVRITVASASGALLERDAFINVGEAPAATGIDRTVPSIVRIDVPAEGRYEAGREMVFKLAMSEAADIDTTSGSPTLDLALQTDAGARSASATFDALASTPTTKVFRYVVPAGEAVVSASVSRLQLNRAAVADGAQNRLGVETSITLDDAANVFGGSVYASGGVIVLRDSTALQAVLAASADAVLRAGGAITVSATVSGSGSDLSLMPASGGTVSFGRTAVSGDLTVSTDGAAISQTGWLAVGGLAQISAAGQSVTLANPDNDFGGRTVVTGGTVSVADINALTLEARASGNLTVRSGGELAIDPTVSGSLEITAIGGSVRFARTLDLSPGATLRIDGADAVRFDAGIGLTGPAYADPVRITSSRAGGSVVSFAAGLLAGDSNSFELAGVGRFAPQVRLDNGRLVLDDLAVQGMAGAALALRPVNGRSVALLEVADLDIASSGGMQLDGQIRAATLLARSTAGAISQGAGASLRIDGSTRLEASGDISVLSADNRFADTVRLSGAAVALRDGNDLDVVLSASGDSVLASAGALSVVATVTGAGNDLQLESAGAITLGELAVGGALSTSGNGALTQTAALRVTGPLSVSAGSGAVTLEHTGNLFDGA